MNSQCLFTLFFGWRLSILLGNNGSFCNVGSNCRDIGICENTWVFNNKNNFQSIDSIAFFVRFCDNCRLWGYLNLLMACHNFVTTHYTFVTKHIQIGNSLYILPVTNIFSSIQLMKNWCHEVLINFKGITMDQGHLEDTQARPMTSDKTQQPYHA